MGKARGGRPPAGGRRSCSRAATSSACKVVADSHLTAYDVLDCKHLVVTQEAIDKLEERLTPLVRE